MVIEPLSPFPCECQPAVGQKGFFLVIVGANKWTQNIEKMIKLLKKCATRMLVVKSPGFIHFLERIMVPLTSSVFSSVLTDALREICNNLHPVFTRGCVYQLHGGQNQLLPDRLTLTSTVFNFWLMQNSDHLQSDGSRCGKMTRSGSTVSRTAL